MALVACSPLRKVIGLWFSQFVVLLLRGFWYSAFGRNASRWSLAGMIVAVSNRFGTMYIMLPGAPIRLGFELRPLFHGASKDLCCNLALLAAYLTFDLAHGMPYVLHMFTIRLDVHLSYIGLVDVNQNEENDNGSKVVLLL